MQFITLTTEWAKSDYYSAAIKGAILSNQPNCSFVDISNDIPKGNIAQAAFALRSCYRHFPKNTIHFICISTEANEQNKHIVVKYQNQFFICTDTGILGLLFDTLPEQIIQLETLENQTTFPELYVFASAAIHIMSGKDIEELGNQIHELNKKVSFLPSVERKTDEIVLTGNVIYIDSYENVITNIHKKQFEELTENRKFLIYPNTTYERYLIKKINQSYNETEEGEILAIFNSLGLLEIAQKEGKASSALDLNIKSNIRIVIK